MGGRPPTVTDDEILTVFLTSDDPVLTTTEVKNAIGFSTSDGTLKRLNELVEKEYLAKKQPGNDLLWWLTEDGREHLRSRGVNDSF